MALSWTINVLAIAVMAVLVCDGWELTDSDVETINVMNLRKGRYYTRKVDDGSEITSLLDGITRQYADLLSKYNVKEVSIKYYDSPASEDISEIQKALKQCKGYTTLKLSGYVPVVLLPEHEDTKDVNTVKFEYYTWDYGWNENILASYPDIPHLSVKSTNFLHLNIEPLKKLVTLHLEMSKKDYQKPTGEYMQLDQDKSSTLTRNVVRNADTLKVVTIIPCPQELAKEITKFPVLEKARIDIGNIVQWRKGNDVENNYFRVTIGKSARFDGSSLVDLPFEFQRIEIETREDDFSNRDIEVMSQLWAWIAKKDESVRKNITSIAVTINHTQRVVIAKEFSEFLPSLKDIHLVVSRETDNQKKQLIDSLQKRVQDANKGVNVFIQIL